MPLASWQQRAWLGFPNIQNGTCATCRLFWRVRIGTFICMTNRQTDGWIDSHTHTSPLKDTTPTHTHMHMKIHINLLHRHMHQMFYRYGMFASLVLPAPRRCVLHCFRPPHRGEHRAHRGHREESPSAQRTRRAQRTGGRARCCGGQGAS